jgi:predicted nucleotide-binding protein
MIKKDAITRLQKLLSKVEGLKTLSPDQPDIGMWVRNTGATISQIFGSGSENLTDFYEIQFDRSWKASWDAKTIYMFRQEQYLDGLGVAQSMLESMIKEIQEYWDDETQNTTNSSSGEAENAGSAAKRACVFIGHGRSPLWARLQVFLENDLGLKTTNFESESRAGESIVAILEKMLSEAGFAVLILTAEDETESGSRRARQNVVHEAGLFQGKLGFNKAILLVQEGLEEFSNVAGLQHISFSGGRIDQTFYEVQRVLKREGVIA